MKTGRTGLPVLTYHTISTRRSVTATGPAWFAETLAALTGAGYHAVDLDDWVARGRPDEPDGFALVFDDGLRSILRVADVVARFRIPATVFLVAGRVGTDNAWPGQRVDVPIEPLLSWSEIAELATAGFQFGAHGMSHARLDGTRSRFWRSDSEPWVAGVGTPPPEALRVGRGLADRGRSTDPGHPNKAGKSPEAHERLRFDEVRLHHELADSRAAIEDKLGKPCRLLAYPDGASSPTVRIAAARVFSAAFGTRLDYADGDQDPFDLARIDAYYLRTPRALDALVNDHSRGWLGWRRALRAVRRRAEWVSR